MKIIFNIKIFLIIAALVLGSAMPAAAEVVSREYKIKAAFIYNFMKIIEWPQDIIKAKQKSKQNYVIAIVGKDPFGKDILPITRKKVNGLKVSVVRFPGPSQIKDMKYDQEKKQYPYLAKLNSCDVVFVANSERAYLKRIIQGIRTKTVLTIGESYGFLEAGGIINFIPSKNKTVFEINNDAARKAKLKINSKLLRLARRVIDTRSRKRQQ